MRFYQVAPDLCKGKEGFFTYYAKHIDHCRGSLVREGGSLESYWCSHLKSSNLFPGVSLFLLKN